MGSEMCIRDRVVVIVHNHRRSHKEKRDEETNQGRRRDEATVQRHDLANNDPEAYHMTVYWSNYREETESLQLSSNSLRAGMFLTLQFVVPFS